MKSCLLFPVLATLAIAARVHAATIGEQCESDLASLPGFLLENDAGAKAALARLGQAHFDVALTDARARARNAATPEACNETLNAYLDSWRKGHLGIRPAQPDPGQRGTTRTPPIDLSDVPTATFLSDRTALLRIPSFAARHREPLIALIEQHRTMLADRPNWIIDVRNNGGGSDWTYYPLLPWLMPDGWVEVGAAWLVTPTNIRVQETICTDPGDSECRTFVEKAVKRMRSAPANTFVQQDEGPAVQHARPEKVEPRRPSRIAILMDHGCVSSCEEFLLAVRQSFSVKLFGRPSAGSLDYSNLRPHTLPSGARVLWYATTRSLRLPDLPVDVAGVQPDVYLPVSSDGHDEIASIQRWMETGTFSPGGAVPAMRE